MAGSVGTLESLAKQIALMLQPLENSLTPQGIIPLLAELGIQFPASLTSQAAFMHEVTAGGSAAGQLTALITQLTTDITNGDDTAIVTDGAKIIEQISNIISAFGKIGTELSSVAGSFGSISSSEVNSFASNLTENLLSYLVISYIANVQPGAVGLANLLTIFDYLPNPGVAGDPAHPPYISKRLQLSNLGQLFSSPTKLLETASGWTPSAIDVGKLIPRLASTLDLLGLFTSITGPGTGNTINTTFLDLTATSSDLTASLHYAIPGGYNLNIPLNALWSLNIQTAGTIAAGATATITPPDSFLIKPSGVLTGSLQTNLVAAPSDPGDPIVIFGETGGSVLQAGSFSFGAGAILNWDPVLSTTTLDPSIQFAVTGGLLHIDMSEADGFLSDVTSGTPIQATFAFSATWAPDTGLHVTGGAQLEIDLPLHLELGPVTLDTIYVILGLISAGLTLELSAAMGVTLGPIQASVDRLGLLGTLTFPTGGGNLGPANLKIGFKPPVGLGIQVDAGLATGGGYISFDPSKGQYAGVLDVSLADIVQVKVIGVINTIMPDGSSGFSFILIITFELPPIELGFGFTLNGVGGIGGVNRSMSVNALQQGFMAHTLDSIMFPPDPVANAPEIISNIVNFFPIAQGRYVFGPEIEIGWGTPTLITFQIGVILSIPNPIVIALLGLISAGLPDTETALISLNIEVLGTLDMGTSTIEIDGQLYDSYVLIYTMAGSLFFRVCWGNDPNFIYSLGGFNPNYNTAGLNIPPLNRCSVSIGDGDNPRISANNYFAVSSNSLQFGANVQAYASAAGFTVQGYLGFDVLIIFSPFSFEFDFSVSFSISFDGISLVSLTVSGSFSGPRPWNFNGSASISFFFFSVSASLNITWGDSTPVVLPQKPVLPDLEKALEAVGNWSASLPTGMTPAISLTAPKQGSSTILVYPMGTLSVRQNVVPLDFSISLYANATPSDGTYFSISQVQINGNDATKQNSQEYFAPGQFKPLSDADKLSLPSFELYDAGVTISSTEIVSGDSSARTVEFEERYIDSQTGFSRFSQRYRLDSTVYAALINQGAGYLSPVKNSGLNKFSVGAESAAVTTSDAGFVVASVTDLSVRTDISTASGTTYFQAQTALNSHLAQNPGDAGNLQVMAVYEAAS
jgi:hypothetical protein